VKSNLEHIKFRLLSQQSQLIQLDNEGLPLASDDLLFPVAELGSGSVFDQLPFPSDLRKTVLGLPAEEVQWYRGISVHLPGRDGVFDFAFFCEGGHLYWLISDLSHAWKGTNPERWANSRSSQSGRITDGPIRILLAEDNPFNQKVTLRQLARMGFESEAVENGQEAVDALGRQHFDLVLMDLNMPVMNGYEAFQHIRQKSLSPVREIPVVALSSSGLTSHDPGFDAVLKKPAQSELLKQTILGLLRHLTIDSQKADQAAHIRLDYLREVTQDNREMMVELMDIYLQEVPTAIKLMRECVEKQEWRALRELSHKTKANFRYVGADQMFSLADTIERYAASGSLVGQIPEMLAQLEALSIPTAQALLGERNAMYNQPPTE
jgi:CheY-like chemotaxis protein